jgi:hypothetical protein
VVVVGCARPSGLRPGLRSDSGVGVILGVVVDVEVALGLDLVWGELVSDGVALGGVAPGGGVVPGGACRDVLPSPCVCVCVGTDVSEGGRMVTNPDERVAIVLRRGSYSAGRGVCTINRLSPGESRAGRPAPGSTV